MRPAPTSLHCAAEANIASTTTVAFAMKDLDSAAMIVVDTVTADATTGLTAAEHEAQGLRAWSSLSAILIATSTASRVASDN